MIIVKRNDYTLRVERELKVEEPTLEKAFEKIAEEYRNKGYMTDVMPTGQLIAYKEGSCYSFIRNYLK